MLRISPDTVTYRQSSRTMNAVGSASSPFFYKQDVDHLEEDDLVELGLQTTPNTRSKDDIFPSLSHHMD